MGACGAIEFGRVCKWIEACERLRAVRVIYPDSMPIDIYGWTKPVMKARLGKYPTSVCET